MALKVLDENPNFVEDTDKGIILPTRLAHVQYIPHAFDDPNKPRGSGMAFGLKHVQGIGTLLEHDPDTGIAFWPAYASGLDDFLMRSLVQGYMGNSGQTPVVDTLLSTIVAKIQGMVGTWVNTVRGKESPVKKTLDLMSRANDSPFGSAEFVREYMGALNVDNRGAIGAQVPIGIIEIDKWSEYGMELEVIEGQRKSGQTNFKPELFVLRMTEAAFRENQGLYMLDGLTCLPTGSKEYPYWVRKQLRSEKRDVWVLIHRDFGFQILQQSGSRNDLYKGFGQSGAWRYSPYEIKHMAIDQMDWEHLINQPMRGIVWVSGLDTPTQFRDQLIKYREELEESEATFYPGVFFGGSQGENSQVVMMPWVEPPSGYTPKEWEDLKVSKLAAAFHLNETHLQLKLGEGAMTQSGVAQSLEAETAVAWMRHTIEMIWNYVAPPRVSIQVVWPSDRARRFQVETWREMSLAMSRLLSLDKDKPDEERIYSRNEIRALTTEFIGVEIPAVEDDDEVVTDRSGPDDIGELLGYFNPANEQISELGLSRQVVFCKGNKVRLKSGTHGVITGWAGNADWVWIRAGKFEMLVPATGFEVKEYSEEALERLGFSKPVDLNDMSEEDWKAGVEAGSIIAVGEDHDSWRDPSSMENDPLEPITSGPDTEISLRVRSGEASDPLVPPHIFHAGQRVVVGEHNTEATVIQVTDNIIFIKFDWDTDTIDPRGYFKHLVLPLGFEPEEGEPLDFPTEVETDQDEATVDSKELWTEVSPEGKEDLL